MIGLEEDHEEEIAEEKIINEGMAVCLDSVELAPSANWFL